MQLKEDVVNALNSVANIINGLAQIRRQMYDKYYDTKSDIEADILLTDIETLDDFINELYKSKLVIAETKNFIDKEV